MRNAILAVCLVAVSSATLRADLKYTTHMEIKKSDAVPAQPPNPMLGMLGEGVMKQMVPEGAADVEYLVGDKGARIEYLQAAMGQAAGTVNIITPDGSLIVMNPKEKTYFKTSVQTALESMKSAGVPTPDVTAKRTGQFETVAGTRCEVILFDWKMALPIPEAARTTLPPDFPTTLTMNGDSCATTDQYQKYAEIVNKGAYAMMNAMGFDKITQGGIVLRQTMQMMGFVMTSAVTKIGEEPAAPNAYEVPADYKEVPMPGPGK
jgi:uncharacterized protein DUF4412